MFFKDKRIDFLEARLQSLEDQMLCLVQDMQRIESKLVALMPPAINTITIKPSKRPADPVTAPWGWTNKGIARRKPGRKKGSKK